MNQMNPFKKYPAIVLLGQIGSGKTTLLNKICNSDEKCQSGGESVTRNLYLKASAYGNGFLIMDTPGFGSDIDQLAHISAIYAALIERPLNRIVLVVEWGRFPTMRKQLKEIMIIFERYKNLVIVVVTHWDQAKNPYQDEESLKTQVLAQLGLNAYVLAGNGITGEQICLQIDKLLLNSGKQEVEITQTEFLQQFDLSQSEFFSFELQKSTTKLKEEFNAICKVCIDFILEQDGKSLETAELMHALIVAIKHSAHTMIEDFQKDQGQTFDNLLKKYGNLELAYLYPMHLKKAVTDKMKDVIDVAQDKMKAYPYHIFNFIKQCDKCGLIWFKVSGCPNTTCGAFPTADDANFQPKFAKYIVKLTKKGVEVIKQNFSEKNSKQYVAPADQSKLKGCGKALNWDNLPPLPNQILEELKNSGFLDFLNKSYDDEKKLNDNQFWNITQKELTNQINNTIVDLRNLQK